MKRIICKAECVSVKGNELEKGIIFNIIPNYLTKQHQVLFKIKNNKIGVYVNNKRLTKCDLSWYFSAWDYYSIYWDNAKYEDIAQCLYNELLESI